MIAVEGVHEGTADVARAARRRAAAGGGALTQARRTTRIGFHRSAGMLRAARHEFELERAGASSRTATARRSASCAAGGRRCTRRSSRGASRCWSRRSAAPGSMLLMRLLSSHPEVLVYRPHRFEQRIAGYWIDVLLALSEPASYFAPDRPAAADVEDPDVVARDRSARCRGRCATRPCRSGSAARRWRRWPRRASSGSTRSTTASPRRPAPGRARCSPRSRNLACLVACSPSCTRMAASCSWCATSATWSARSWRSTRSAACRASGAPRRRATWSTWRRSAAGPTSLARAWERRRDRAHLVRYEDLVLDPERTLAGLLDHLGVDSSTRHHRGHAERARGGHAGAARSRDQRLRTGLDRPLAHGPRPRAGRGLRAGASAPRWSCSATSGNRNEPARALWHQSRDVHTLPKLACRVAYESPVYGSAKHGLGALERLHRPTHHDHT